MKRSAAGTPRSKNYSSWEDASFSSSQTSQLEMMNYLGLTRPNLMIQIKDCKVSIEGSKCKVCKHSFKCRTDTERHMRKRHKYLVRKKDNKLVRVVMRFGKEKFCDSEIDQKYLVPPSPSKGFGQKPLEVSSTEVHKNVPMNISKDLIVQGSVSLSNAIFDIKALNENASYKNGRICRGEASQSSSSAGRVDLKKEESLLIPSAFEACGGRSTPASCISDSETIIYISDIEMDLGEDYAACIPDAAKVKEEDESDDGEVVFVKKVIRNDFQSIQKRTERTGCVSMPSDIGVIIQADGKIKMEPEGKPLVNGPFAQVSNTQVPNAHSLAVQIPTPEVEIAPATVSHVPVAQDSLTQQMKEMMDDDLSDAETVIGNISDAETESLGDYEELTDVNKDIASLLDALEGDDTSSTFDLGAGKISNEDIPELPEETSYNFIVEQRPAPAVEDDDSIIVIDDDEPYVVDQILPQSDLTKKIKDFLLTHAKENNAADRRRNTNEISDYLLQHGPKYQLACQQAFKELGIKVEPSWD